MVPLLPLGLFALFVLWKSSSEERSHPQRDNVTPLPSPNLALAQAQAWADDLSYTIPESKFDYDAAARIYFPADLPSWSIPYMKSKKSLCAVFAKAYLREGGCRCHEHGPYQHRTGLAVADVESIARRHGAWRNTNAERGMFPPPGDIITVDAADPHVLIVDALNPDDIALGAVPSLDSGNPNCRTARRKRMLRAPDNGATPFLEDMADGVSARVGRQRPIWGRTDAQAVFNSLHLCK